MPADPYHRFKSVRQIADNVFRTHIPGRDIEALSRQFERVLICWADCAPKGLGEFVTPVRLDHGILQVETHSPVWANKARYLVKPTLENLHTLGFTQIRSIRVRVNPGRR